MKSETKTLLTQEQEQAAVTAIHNFAKDSKTAAKATDNLSKHVLGLAKLALKIDKARAVEIFGALCRHGETVIKQENAKGGKEPPIKALLPFWPVVKSQVLQGLKSEKVDVSKVESVYQMTQELGAEKKTRKTGGNAGDEAGKVTMPKELEGVWTRLNAALKEIILKQPQLITAAGTTLTECVEELEEMAHIEAESQEKKAA